MRRMRNGPSRWNMKADRKQAQQEEKVSAAVAIRREIIAWSWVVLTFLLINGTLGQARVIPSGSMQNTLLIGDHLLMSRLGYDAGIPFTSLHVPLWRNPRRQQIIIFRPPFDPHGEDLIKRVIGMPGDTLDLRDGVVWVNGTKLQETYALGSTEPLELAFPYKVPENCYFVMGDNRGNSYDSRAWGCVPRQNLIGTPVLTYMSLDASPQAWESGHLGDRFGAYLNAVLHPGTVRWRRLFQLF